MRCEQLIFVEAKKMKENERERKWICAKHEFQCYSLTTSTNTLTPGIVDCFQVIIDEKKNQGFRLRSNI